MFWHLQRAQAAGAALGSITARAEEAYRHVVLAQSALAETDFGTSEEEFAQAETLLVEAREELATALSSSRYVLRTLDVTGRVKSGDSLLLAGEELTVAGQALSRGAERLFGVGFFASEGEEVAVSLVDAIEDSEEDFVTAYASLETSAEALAAVEVAVLPESVQEQVRTLQVVVPRARDALGAYLDESHLLLRVLGAERQRQYLLLFQNNHELRPTGGFIGTLGLVNVDRGVVESIDVQSVYDPDGQLREFIAPPDPLLSVTDRWYLRDANWFVDYRVSAQKIADLFEKEGGPTVDGVIALTPEVIIQLLRVTGPITLPQHDVTIDADNFIELTQDKVTYSYDREVNRPKQFLADLTPVLLNKLVDAPIESRIAVLGALSRTIQEKQLLFYFRDAELQAQVDAAGWSGAFPKAAQGFLHVNNANIGGHKSDQFVSQEIDYRSEVLPNGDVEAVVTVRRTHHGPEEALPLEYPEGENPAYKDNVVYQRVFVPPGAELLEAQGFTSAAAVPRADLPDTGAALAVDPQVAEWQRVQRRHSSGTVIGEEAGYAYFGNWFITTPGSTTIGLYRYRLPQQATLPGLLDPAEQYRVHVAKQPGDMRTDLRVAVTLPSATRIVHTVPNDGITQSSASEFVYRGALKSDLVVGTVFVHN